MSRALENIALIQILPHEWYLLKYYQAEKEKVEKVAIL
jgi:hypothetical protein